MEIAWEQWTKCAVNKTACEDFLVTCLALTLCEATRETTCSSVLLAILNLQWHEICSRNCIFCCANSSEEYCVTHLQGTRTISLLCELTGLNGDLTTIRKRDCL